MFRRVNYCTFHDHNHTSDADCWVHGISACQPLHAKLFVWYFCFYEDALLLFISFMFIVVQFLFCWWKCKTFVWFMFLFENNTACDRQTFHILFNIIPPCLYRIFPVYKSFCLHCCIVQSFLITTCKKSVFSDLYFYFFFKLIMHYILDHLGSPGQSPGGHKMVVVVVVVAAAAAAALAYFYNV